MEQFIKTCGSAPSITVMAELFKQMGVGENNALCCAAIADKRMFTNTSTIELSKLQLRNSTCIC